MSSLDTIRKEKEEEEEQINNKVIVYEVLNDTFLKFLALIL